MAFTFTSIPICEIEWHVSVRTDNGKIVTDFHFFTEPKEEHIQEMIREAFRTLPSIDPIIKNEETKLNVVCEKRKRAIDWTFV